MNKIVIKKEMALELADILIGWEEAMHFTNSPTPTREEQQEAFANLTISYLSGDYYKSLEKAIRGGSNGA